MQANLTFKDFVKADVATPTQARTSDS